MDTNIIYNENCLNTMAKMPDNFVDLTVTSPPYDNLRKYNGYSFEFEKIAKELFRVTKDGGVVVWIVNDATIKGSESLTSFKQAIYFVESCGFRLHDTMIYEAEKPPLSHNRYEPKFEFMFILSKGNLKTFNAISAKSLNFGNSRKSITMRQDSDSLGERCSSGSIKETKIIGNIWKYNIGYGGSTNDKIAFEHPAIFPEKLAQDHIISWSNEGDLVYDCFGGSGTTAKMAHLNNRKWILSEISSEYCEISRKRLQPHLNQHNLFFDIV